MQKVNRIMCPIEELKKVRVLYGLLFKDKGMLEIKREWDEEEKEVRWRIEYWKANSYHYSIASKDVTECLREVWKYAKSKKLPEEELKLIADIATSDMLKEWMKENE